MADTAHREQHASEAQRLDRYIPVLRGNLYCSPACGWGCTKASHDLARAQAEEVAKGLGPSWEINLWESTKRWCWEVTNGAASIRPDGARFRAELRLDGLAVLRQIFAEADSPDEALGFAVQDARSALGRAKNDLDALLE